jgi:hypothetical protein
MYRDSCAREGFKADLRHPDVSITEQAYVYRYGMNDTVWNRVWIRYLVDYDITAVLFVPVPCVQIHRPV